MNDKQKIFDYIKQCLKSKDISEKVAADALEILIIKTKELDVLPGYSDQDGTFCFTWVTPAKYVSVDISDSGIEWFVENKHA